MSQSANEKLEPENRIINWGKYRNKKFGEVPTDYLQWFIKNSYHQMVDRTRWAQEELNRRDKLK